MNPGYQVQELSGKSRRAVRESRASGSVNQRGMRYDIQALRAIAVSGVVINHLWPQRLTGGYVGVDIFFVVSGFLITLHLLRELEVTGRLRFGQFYMRRAKRLLPAAYLVAAVGLVGTVLFLPQARWADTAWQTIASTFYIENWYLAAQSVDYSAHDNSATTVQHYWSLSVEEQFYLFWPLLLVGGGVLARRLSWNQRRLIVVVLIVIALTSFALAVVYTDQVRSQAYFITPTRVWEFTAGSMLAVVAPWLNRLLVNRSLGRGILQSTGLVLLAWSLLTFDSDTAFPGPWAILPVLGTVMIIGAGPTPPRFTPMRLLRWRPVHFIGDISYSLYLWHWPLIVIVPFVFGREMQLSDRLLILGLSVFLAWLTKKLIEDPGRTVLLRTASPYKFTGVFALFLVVMTLLSSLVLWADHERTVRGQEAVAARETVGCLGAEALDPNADCGDPFAGVESLALGDAEAPWFEVPECRYENGLSICPFDENGPSVWLVGDSHAEHWKSPIVGLARQRGWNLTMALRGGCPVVQVPRVSFDGGPKDSLEQQNACLDWSQQVTTQIGLQHPDLIITSAFSSAEEIDDGTGRSQDEQYRDGVVSLLEQWGEGTRVLAVRDVPRTLGTATIDCLSKNMKDPRACSNPRELALTPDPYGSAFAALDRPGATFLDLTDRFCDNDRCYALIGGTAVYFDQNHLSRSYARSLKSVIEEHAANALSKPMNREYGRSLENETSGSLDVSDTLQG